MTMHRPEGMTDIEKLHTWSKIESQLTTPVPFSYRAVMMRMRRRSVAVILGCSLLLGGATTAFAHNAMPGDILFPLTIATEEAQIFLASDNKKKEVLRIKFAEKRLAQVRELASTMTTPTTGAQGGTGTTSIATTTLPASEQKKIARTERALAVALSELEKARTTLAENGSDEARFIMDDIIKEMRGVGDGRVTIVRLKSDDDDDKRKTEVRAIVTSTTTGDTIWSGKVKIEEKKNGVRIKIDEEDRVTNDEAKDDDEDHRGRGRDDDEDEDEEDDEEEDDDRRVSLCHKSDGQSRTITVSSRAARAHVAHGDTLGKCAQPNPTDTTVPTLTALTGIPFATGVTLRITASEETTTQVWVNQGDTVETNRTPTTVGGTWSTNHTITITGLTSSTTYSARLSAKDKAGLVSTSSVLTFTTPAVPSTLDLTPPVVSMPNVSGITETRATFSWSTNEPTKARVRVATSTALLDTAPTISLSTFALAHQTTYTGLESATSYVMRVSVEDSAGNTATSSILHFTTASSPTDTTAPTVSHIQVSTTTQSATITWSTNELATALLYAGIGSTPTSFTPLAIETPTLSGSAVLSSLLASSTYTFVIVVKDGSGNTATSSTSSFQID